MLQMTAADYLEHSLLFGAVQTYLQQHAKALRVLDLGCGDSQNISKLLSAAPEVVASYTGGSPSAQRHLYQKHLFAFNSLGSADTLRVSLIKNLPCRRGHE